MDINIGERVQVRAYEDLPEDIKRKGLSKHAGKSGEIVDIVFSNAKQEYFYKIQFDGCDEPSRTNFPVESFDLEAELEQATYTYEFEFAENLVVARLYESKGDQKEMIARGHGHIFHDGAYGIAQAASYALRRIYLDLGGEQG